MHEVKIKIVSLEILQRGVERLLGVIRVVRVVPELGGDEELITWDARFLDSIADSLFRAIDSSCVDVFVASLPYKRHC